MGWWKHLSNFHAAFFLLSKKKKIKIKGAVARINKGRGIEHHLVSNALSIRALFLYKWELYTKTASPLCLEQA